MGTPRPSAAASITALRSMAAAIARRTRTSSSGLRLLLTARMVLPREALNSTWKRLSFWNCGRLRETEACGNRSTSPESSAVACAAGSEMKRKLALRICTASALRYPSHLASTMAEPLAQLSSR